MKIRHKKKRPQFMRPNVAWFMATAAIFHFSSYAPQSAWGKEPNDERDLTSKEGEVLDRMSRIQTRHKIVARFDNEKQSEMNFDIQPGPLASVLRRFGEQAGVQFAYTTEDVEGIHTSGVSGIYTPEEALRLLLSNTGLYYRVTGANTITLEKGAPTSSLRMQADIVTQEFEGIRSENGTVGPDEPKEDRSQKPIKIPEVIVKEVVERPRFGDSPPELGGFKADYQSSATKMPLPLKDTPKSITVITRESMDARQVRDLTTALELSAGLIVGSGSTLGGPFAGRGLATGESFNLRGQDLNENRDIRVDGFSVPASSFDMAAYERVEVVKGATSMMYGQGSIGGFVNLIRKKPLEERVASVVTQIGSFDTYRGEADVTGPLDKDKRFLGRLTAAYDTGRSFINGVDTRVAMVAPSLTVRISERTRALFQLLYQDDKFVPSHGIPLRVVGDKLVIPNISRSLFVGVPTREKSTSENMVGSLRVDHEISDR